MAEENSVVQIRYNGQDILVSKKVADFLERDRKKMAALQRSDRRHIILNPEEAIGFHVAMTTPVEYHVIKNLFLEKLQEAAIELTDDEKKLIQYRFYNEMTLNRIGEKFGI